MILVKFPATVAPQVEEIISDETIIKNHPFVDNPEDEIKKMKEQTEANTPFQDKVPLEDVNEDEEEQ